MPAWGDLPDEIKDEIVGRLPLTALRAVRLASRSTGAAAARARWERFDALEFAWPLRDLAARRVAEMLRAGRIRGFRSLRVSASDATLGVLEAATLEPDEVWIEGVDGPGGARRALGALRRVAGSVRTLAWRAGGTAEPVDAGTYGPVPTFAAASSLHLDGGDDALFADLIRACPALRTLVLVRKSCGSALDGSVRAAVRASGIEVLHALGCEVPAEALDGTVAGRLRVVNARALAPRDGARFALPNDDLYFFEDHVEYGFENVPGTFAALGRMARLERLTLTLLDEAGSSEVPRDALRALRSLRSLCVQVSPASGRRVLPLPEAIARHAEVAPGARYELVFHAGGGGAAYRTWLLESTVRALADRGIAARFTDASSGFALSATDLPRELRALEALRGTRVSLRLAYRVARADELEAVRRLAGLYETPGLDAVAVLACEGAPLLDRARRLLSELNRPRRRTLPIRAESDAPRARPYAVFSEPADATAPPLGAWGTSARG